MGSLHRRLLGEHETSDNPDPNFDTNMVIILAALLCALLITLALNAFMRCAFRCRNGTLSGPETSEREARSMGTEKRGLNEIPMRTYGSGLEIPGTECPICLAEFVVGEKVRVLPKCNHGFHVKCIDTWLASHSTCPNCRHLVIEIRTTVSDIVGGQLQHCPPNYMM